MLPNHSPLKVAESYRLLEALHPGRIDLGIGGAPGTDPLTAVALRRSRAALETDDFLDQLAELMAYDAGTFPPTHPFRNIRAMPDDVELPPIWLLGSGDYSAQLAAELGLGFAFAGHFSPEPAEGPMRLYRSLFGERGPRDGGLRAPHAILALAVYCADTEAEAKRMASSIRVAFAQLRTGKPDRLPSPEEALARELTPQEEAAAAFFDRIGIVGAPEQVKARIDEAVERTRADEVMIATHAYDSAARIRSHELVAQLYDQPR
jgi:luciferase family oxidoreductase group 1